MHGCEKCGRLDSTLRGAGFSYAVSALVMTFRRPGSAGIFCSRCRKKEAFKYSLVSALFGWWGIPWGPIYTLQTIGQNSAGGYQDNDFNADLLAAVGAELAESGDRTEATRALETSLSLVDQAEVRQLLWAVQGASLTADAPTGHRAPTAPGAAVDKPAPTPAETPPSATQPQFSPGDLVRWHATTPMRQQPAGESEVVVSLEPDEAIVTRVSGGWTQIRAINGQSGWVPTTALTRD